MSHITARNSLILLVFSIAGFFLGKLVSPSPPIYPFMASECEIEYILYRELHIELVIGFVTLLITILAAYKLKTSHMLAFLFALSTWIGEYILMEYVQFGQWPGIHPLGIASFLCGALAAYGSMHALLSAKNKFWVHISRI